MFVLAIAGLILLIVFEAIPALQRSSVNNQRRQDVLIILQAISHYELSNSGTFPGNCGGIGEISCAASPSIWPPNGGPLHYENPINNQAGKLTYYISLTPTATTSGQVTIDPQTISPLRAGISARGPQTSTQHVSIYNYAKCDPNNPGKSTAIGASYNDVVALYALASASSYVPQCQAL